MDYSLLVCGGKKVGKTRFASFIPGALMLALEQASVGRAVYKRKPEDWSDIKKIVRHLEKKGGDKFPAVVFDTFDVAYNMATEHICDKLGIEQLGETSSGKRDYGYSYSKVKEEVLKVLLRIERSGRMVVLICHTKIRDLMTISGMEYQKIMPATTPSAIDIIKKFTQMNIMLDYVRVKGKKQRIILTQGDEHYFAGCGDPSIFPPILPLLHCKNMKTGEDKTEDYGGRTWNSPFELFQEAFKGNVEGIDPERIDTVIRSEAITDESLEKLADKKEVKRKKAGKKKLRRRKE